MDLATIDDAEENQFLRSRIATDAYIGLSDSEREGAWKWASDRRLTWCDEAADGVGEGTIELSSLVTLTHDDDATFSFYIVLPAARSVLWGSKILSYAIGEN